MGIQKKIWAIRRVRLLGSRDFWGCWIVLCFTIFLVAMVAWKQSWKIKEVVLSEVLEAIQQSHQRSNVSSSVVVSPVPIQYVAPPPSSRLLCQTLRERLGNQMFQVASTLGLAWTMNRTPVFVGESTLDMPLRRSLKWSNQAELEERCIKGHFIYEDNCYRFEHSLTELDPNLDCSFRAYLQSWKYFDKFRAQVKQALTFNQAVVKEAETIIARIRNRHKTAILIGVHIRRGDFELEREKKSGYPMASSRFLNTSFAYFQRLFTNCVFVIASENIRWCRENTPPGAQVEYLDVHSPAVDMSVLVSMDHVITTFGSYSWWIGYLNQGITVYTKDFIVPGTRIGNMFQNPDDYVYPGWVPL